MFTEWGLKYVALIKGLLFYCLFNFSQRELNLCEMKFKLCFDRMFNFRLWYRFFSIPAADGYFSSMSYVTNKIKISFGCGTIPLKFFINSSSVIL